MVTTPGPTRPHDEIDLMELFLKGVLLVRSYFWMIVIFFMLGVGLGFGYYTLTKRQYESKMIISSNILTTSYAKILFDNANSHLTDGDYEVLAKDLGLSAEDARQIASLQIENLTKTEGNELKESERYLITATVFEQAILPALQKGIVDYLEHNEFVRIRVEQQKNTLTQMLGAVEKELSDMQQFKDEIYSGRFFAKVKGNIMFDPTTVNTKLLELTQRRIDIKNALELINSVQLIEGFTPFKHHKKPSFTFAIAGGAFFGLFIVGMVIVFKSIRRLLRMAEANETKNAA